VVSVNFRRALQVAHHLLSAEADAGEIREIAARGAAAAQHDHLGVARVAADQLADPGPDVPGPGLSQDRH
jgi:hypothetical protein